MTARPRVAAATTHAIDEVRGTRANRRDRCLMRRRMNAVVSQFFATLASAAVGQSAAEQAHVE
jgi:hypothetical protein